MESNKLEREIFSIRKSKNPASEQAAAQYMSKTFTPYALQTKATTQELVDSLQQLSEAESAKMEAAASSAIFMLLLTTLLAIVSGSFAAFYISRRISAEVNKILERAKAIAGGDLSGKPLEATSQDEVADLALAMNEMSGSLRNLVGDISGGVQTLAASATELSCRIDTDRLRRCGYVGEGQYGCRGSRGGQRQHHVGGRGHGAILREYFFGCQRH